LRVGVIIQFRDGGQDSFGKFLVDRRETVAMETLARRATSRMSSVFFFLVVRARRGEFVIVMASGLELLQPAYSLEDLPQSYQSRMKR
jgi:hypothetical protein